jgi:hypothetical protein
VDVETWRGWFQGRQPDKAITVYEAVLADRVRILGPDYPNTLTFV